MYVTVITAPTSILTLSISNERKGEHPRFLKIKGSNWIFQKLRYFIEHLKIIKRPF